MHINTNNNAFDLLQSMFDQMYDAESVWSLKVSFSSCFVSVLAAKKSEAKICSSAAPIQSLWWGLLTGI